MKALFLLAAAVAPLAAQCTYTASPNQFTIGASQYTGQITVVSGTGCAWKYTSDVDWIRFGLPGGQLTMTGQGSGTDPFPFVAAANALPAPPATRVGHITINDANTPPTVFATITVTQVAPICALSIDPQTATIGVNGGKGAVNVTTNCVWTSGASDSWLIITPPGNGTTSGPLSYTAAANPCYPARVAVIGVKSVSDAVGTRSYTLTQDGSPNNFSLSPASFSAPSTETTSSFAVTTGAPCGWNAVAQASWIDIIVGTGAGNGRVTFRVRENTGAARTGLILVGSQSFTVTQSAVPVVSTSLNNAASGASDSISPGTIVSLFGNNMGPAVGVPLQVGRDGTVSTRLAGTRVLFDGKEAPLTYSSATQVNAVAPYGLSPGSTTQVTVEYQGVPSSAVSMPVKAATPGIFTIPPVGTGQGAILNQDSRVNSAGLPAARGDTVAIYLTGAGATTPPSADGSVTAAPYPTLVQPVSVTIGNIDAEIVYKGAAPGAIAGLTQINAKIPATAPTGSSVPIAVTVGGVRSQAGVTIAIQ